MPGRRIVLLGGMISFPAFAQKFGPDAGAPIQQVPPGQNYGPPPGYGQAPAQGRPQDRAFFTGRWRATDTALGSPIQFSVGYYPDGSFTNDMTFPISGRTVAMVGQWSMVGPTSVQLQIRDWQQRQTWNQVENRWVPVQYPSTAVYHYTVHDNQTMSSPGSDRGTQMVWRRM